MATKKKVEDRQQQIEELASREKDKSITREEKYLLSKLRETERRRKKNILLAKERKALAAGKKEALLKILGFVGITTENQLKDILRFVTDVNPKLIPKMSEPEMTPEPPQAIIPEPAEAMEPVAEEIAPDPEPIKEPEPEKTENMTPLEKVRAEFAKRHPDGFAAVERSKVQ